MSLPSKMSSSFCAFDSMTSTPSNILTCRTICREDIESRFDKKVKDMQRTFSPKKLRISRACPSSWMMQFIGKWAYTARILYRNPYNDLRSCNWGILKLLLTLVTPVTILLIKLRIVRRHATCFLPPCQTAKLTFVVLPFSTRISMSICRTFLVRVPRGPVTVMRRAFTSI